MKTQQISGRERENFSEKKKNDNKITGFRKADYVN